MLHVVHVCIHVIDVDILNMCMCVCTCVYSHVCMSCEAQDSGMNIREVILDQGYK